jgi:hypothetical protein
LLAQALVRALALHPLASRATPPRAQTLSPPIQHRQRPLRQLLHRNNSIISQMQLHVRRNLFILVTGTTTTSNRIQVK